MTHDGSVESVARRQAQSGLLSYGDPVLLHETSKKRIVLVPFFIPHSDHTELAAKLITYKKGAPPMEWAVVEDKSVSLNEIAARKLLGALRSHLAVAEENEDGSFLLVRMGDATAQLGDLDADDVAGALVRVLSQPEIRAHLDGVELSSELAAALRTSIRLTEMRTAVAELTTALDSGDNSESTYQLWCERHSWAFGSAHIVRDEVREITPSDHVDLLLPAVIAGYRDIVELKRPDMDVLKYDSARRSYYFSQDVSKAIGQSHRYLDVLAEVAVTGLRDHPEIVAYHPRAIIVIGRSRDWTDDEHRALHGLNARLAGITVMTYDHLLAQGERLVGMLSQQDAADDDIEFDGVWDDDSEE